MISKLNKMSLFILSFMLYRMTLGGFRDSWPVGRNARRFEIETALLLLTRYNKEIMGYGAHRWVSEKMDEFARSVENLRASIRQHKYEFPSWSAFRSEQITLDEFLEVSDNPKDTVEGGYAIQLIFPSLGPWYLDETISTYWYTWKIYCYIVYLEQAEATDPDLWFDEFGKVFSKLEPEFPEFLLELRRCFVESE